MSLLPINKLLDSDGENKAVRCFLLHYQNPPTKVISMRNAFTRAGLQGFWPDFVEGASDTNEHLTKAGAGLWLRHLFDLENKIKISVTTVECAAASQQKPSVTTSEWFEISDTALIEIRNFSGVSIGARCAAAVETQELSTINIPSLTESQTSEKTKDETDLLIEAAEEYSKDFEDDPRDVRADVMNAFFRGSEYEKSRKTT